MEMEIKEEEDMVMEPQDDELCDVCKDGEVYEGNEILFCDKCNVAVHQSCYGIKRIPTGNWFCDVCKINGNPLETKCELCKFTGGAYKQTETKGLWVHQLCANWQPEVFVTEKGGQTYVNMSLLDKSRLRLKCSHCHSTGGASVQCSYGRCVVAVHPWCCLNDPRGFTKRIVKTPDGDTLWEIFCKTHASAISDPVKPHTKKAQRPLQQLRHNNENSSEIEKIETSFSTEKLTRDRSKDGVPKVMTLSMNHAITLQQKNSVGFSLPNSTSSQSPSRANGLSINRTFPIRTMSEWPGQSEGEGMDLDHFWNVISMYHPEDHPVEWLHFMKSGIFEEKDSGIELCIPCLGKTDSYQNFPDEERMFEGISEKQKESIYDYEHRSNLRNRVEVLINSITLGSTYDNDNSNVIKNESMTELSGLVDNSEEKESDAVGNESQYNCYLNDESFFIKETYPNDVLSQNFHAVDKDGFSSLSVVFDGEKRTSCEFNVKLLDQAEAKSINLECDEEHNKWVESYLFQADKSLLVDDEKKRLNAIVELVKFSDFPDDKPVNLAEKLIIPNDENDEICRAIRADLNSLQRIAIVVKNKISSFDALQLEELTKQENEKRLRWAEIERKFESQVAWRKVATCLSRGMRDQKPDFNQIVTESLPASWQIMVDGRPTADQLKEEANEPHEDAVCMVCFDGISKDNNNILFCDGCNASLHQACYGVAEIPEGDFFCDRCRHVLLMTEDCDQKPPPYKIVEMVKCCLCPQYHGGIKPTEDGHWVHMCCAIWTKNSVIKDLKNMSSIDLSSVECDIADPCIYCNLSGGYLRYCNCLEENCLNTFHPICAWFAGAQFESNITDSTFSGCSRDGLYPSGIEVKIYCDKHSNSDNEGRKEEQAQIRKKYSHKIEDQCNLPGRRVSNYSQRKNKKKDAVAAVAQSRVASSQNKNQELKVDIYDYKNCAMCCEVFDKSTQHYETDDKVICHGCSIHVHLKCLQEISPDFESGSSKFWTCDKCMRYPPELAPSEGTWPRCEFCPRRGGAYKPMTDDRWTHVFCASNCNGKKTILPNGELEVKLTGKVDKKHKCSLCNRKEGFLKCYNDGCSSYFHPLCAGRSTRTYIKTNRDGIMVWCTDHLPKWLHRTMQGVWINCADIEFLRWTLTNAQGLSNLVDSRIKLKRHEAKTAGDLFSLRFNKLLDNAKGREELDNNDEENRWIFETEDVYDGPEDEQAIAAAAAAAARVKKEPVVLPPGEQINVMTSWGEMMTISANWTIGTTVNAPKRVTVQHAGVDIIKKSTTVDAGEFKDKIKNGFRRQMQSPDFSSDIFHQYRDVEAFQTTLHDHLVKYCKMPNELFTNEMTKLGVEIDQDMFPSKRKSKKEQQKEKVSPVKRKKESIRPNVVATAKPILKHNYTYIDQNQLMKKLEEAPTLRSFCLSYVQSKPAFDSAMDMLGISENQGFNGEFDDWKLCDKDELPSLERRMLDIINQIIDYEVPEEDNTSKKSSKKNSNNVDMRKLSEDFNEIDLVDFPDYPDCVRRIVDINYIKDNIIKHKYSSMAQFTKDFYDLLNNARSFTDENLPAWKDAEELAKLLNTIKKTSLTDPNSYRLDRPVIKADKLIGSKLGSSSAKTISCGVCSDIYRVTNWPESAWPIEFEEKRGREKLQKWHWKCPSCIESAGSKGTFLNSDTIVKVWWLDDKQYYNGKIDAYDEVSNRYRILYEDDEWEFINIDNEPVLFLNTNTTTTSTTTSNNHNNIDKHSKPSNDDDDYNKQKHSISKSNSNNDGSRKSSRSR